MTCPHCGAEDSIEVMVDAYVVYQFDGFDELGTPRWKGERGRIDEFDESFAQCQACGKKVEA